MKKNIVVAGLVFTLLNLISCNYKQSNELPLDPVRSGDSAMKAEEVDFQLVMEKVMANNCVNCHSQEGGNRGELNLETYENVVQVLTEIREQVSDRTMPPRRAPPLSDEQIQLIIAWIDAGAPEKAEGVVSPADPLPVATNYAIVFTQVIQPSCLKCHSTDDKPSKKGHINLETYADLMTVKDDVRRTVADGSMPRRSKLTDEQKKLILDWIDAGAPE